MALAGRLLGVPACIVMPRTAPAIKRAATEGYGARVVPCEPTLADRAVGELTLTCVQIVQTETLLPGLDEAGAVLRRLALRPNGAYATLVTGPSRTADIEMSLTVGVQGPGKVAVLFVDELYE